MRIFDYLRDRLLTKAGLVEPKKSKFKPSDLLSLEETEWSPEFERLMRNRLLMGALRYGTFAEKKLSMESANPWDLKTPIKTKIELYEKTGNTEYLVDAANYLLLAFEFDTHPKKHFYALDDHHDHCKRVRDVSKGNQPHKVAPCHVCNEDFKPSEPIFQYQGRNYHHDCQPLKSTVYFNVSA